MAVCYRRLKHTRFQIALSVSGSVVDVRYRKSSNAQRPTFNEMRRMSKIPGQTKSVVP